MHHLDMLFFLYYYIIVFYFVPLHKIAQYFVYNTLQVTRDCHVSFTLGNPMWFD
jgi:hypothetical protein